MKDIYLEVLELVVAFARGALLAWFIRDFAKPKLNTVFLGKNIIAPCWGFFLIIFSEIWETKAESLSIIYKQIVIYFALIIMIFLFYNIRVNMLVFLSTITSSLFCICIMMTSLISKIFLYINSKLADKVIDGSISLDSFKKNISISGVLQVTVSYALCLMLYFISLKLIKRGYREKDHVLKKEELVFLIAPSLAGYITALMFRSTMFTIKNGVPVNLDEEYPVIIFFEPVILMLLLIAIISSVYLFQSLIISTRESSAKKLLEKELIYLKENINETIYLNNDIRAMKHDMKNNLLVISGLVDEFKNSLDSEVYDKLGDYLTSLKDDYKKLEKDVYTGDIVIDALLSMKFREAVNVISGIIFDIEKCVFTEADSNIDYDICIILGNALDNAFRACEKTDNPHIKLETKHRGRMLIIEISNPYSGELIISEHDEFPHTDKDDISEHGYGFINMKRVANKHNGDIDYEIGDGIFTLIVMLQT